MSIGLISNSNDLQIERTCLFVGYLGITVRSKRSTVMMKRSIVDHFKHIATVESSMEGLDKAVDKHYKNAFDRRRWITIRRPGCIPRN